MPNSMPARTASDLNGPNWVTESTCPKTREANQETHTTNRGKPYR
ncbi:hypothetical protein YIM73518_26140 [Thermus brockianus]